MTLKEIINKPLFRPLLTTLILVVVNLCLFVNFIRFTDKDYNISNYVKTSLYETLEEEFNDISFNSLVFTSKKSKISLNKEKGRYNYKYDEDLYTVYWLYEEESYTIKKVLKNKALIYEGE